MKKTLIILLSIAVLFGFAACDNNGNDPTTVAKSWYTWDEDSSAWVASEAEVKVADTYNIAISYDPEGETITYKVNDETIASDSIFEAVQSENGTNISGIFLCVKNPNDGSSYSATWTTPTITGTEETGVLGSWTNARGEGEFFSENDTKITTTTTEATGLESYYTYQGAQADVTGITTATSWTASTTLTVGDGLDSEYFAPSVWVRLGDDNVHSWYCLELAVGDVN